ncbi:MAG: regulatory protein RecX [Pyrinomonadaceae bacterium]
MRKTRTRTQPGTEKLTPEEIRRQTFERAANLLAAKSRSVQELRENLSSRGNKAATEAVIKRLLEYGYLDDQRYALTYASSRVKQRPVGRRRLERELKLKKIDSSVADEALEHVYQETSEEELIDRAIKKRVRRGRPKTRAETKSLFDHLLRQGFPFELVSSKVREVCRVEVDED